MNLDELASEHKRIQMELVVKNANPDSRNKDELILALRHGIAGWALMEATPDQILEIVARNKTSHFN